MDAKEWEKPGGQELAHHQKDVMVECKVAKVKVKAKEQTDLLLRLEAQQVK